MHLLPPGMTKEWDREIPKGEAPIACMGAGVSNFDQQLGTRVSSLVEVDHQAIVRNDVTLCSWFAGWAMMKQERFRRFHVITGRDDDSGQLKQLKSSMKKYNHLEIMAFEKFAKKHCVWDWTKIKKEDDKRRAEAKKRDERAVERAKSAAARPSSVGENDGDVEMREVGEEDQESLFLPMDMSST